MTRGEEEGDEDQESNEDQKQEIDTQKQQGDSIETVTVGFDKVVSQKSTEPINVGFQFRVCGQNLKDRCKLEKS
jgi:hypothetical protein